MGNGLGALIAMTFPFYCNHEIFTRIPLFSGIIAQSPMIQPAFKVNPILHFYSKYLGVSTLFSKYQLTKKFNMNLLSLDPKEVQRYQQDPWIHLFVSIGTRKFSSILTIFFVF